LDGILICSFPPTRIFHLDVGRAAIHPMHIIFPCIRDIRLAGVGESWRSVWQRQTGIASIPCLCVRIGCVVGCVLRNSPVRNPFSAFWI
jgi:hypothetical protein